MRNCAIAYNAALVLLFLMHMRHSSNSLVIDDHKLYHIINASSIDHSQQISVSIKFDRYLKSQYGPDEWYVLQIGNSIQAQLLQYNNYIHQYGFVPNCDAISVVFHFYQDYLHVQEIDRTWNPIHKEVHSTLKVRETNQCSSKQSHWNVTQELNVDELIHFLKIDHKEQFHNFLGNRIQYTPPFKTGWWKDSPCIAEQRILFVGDSQTATIFEGLKQIMTNELSPHVKITLRAEQYDNFEAHFLRAPIPNTQVIEYIQDHNISILIWNSGQHPASGDFHLTFEQYKNAMQDFINQLDQVETESHIFAMETISFPPRDDKWVRSFRDWRTNSRIQEYNKILRKLVESSKHPNLIELFDLTLPMIFTSLDNAHYQGFVREAMVEKIMNSACKAILSNN